MSRGLQRAGIEIVCGIDSDPVVVKTYRRNINSLAVCRDVHCITAAELRPMVPKGALLVMAVCAPCQPFSKVRKSGKARKDQDLLLEVGRLVKALRPDGLIVENVPQISRSDRSTVL